MGSAPLLKLLLDTHIWIWSLGEPDRRSRPAARELRNPANELWLSPISVWEFLLLVEKGRATPAGGAERWLAMAFEQLPLNEAVLTHEIARESRRMTLSHQDPADRFIAATARVMELTLVTADERLLRSKETRVLAG